nr:MAG TPA: Protein of unknown function (DUF722) [Caudoviricetes sp.]
MTERDLAQARHLKAESESVRSLLSVELEPSCRRLLAEHLERVERQRFDLMAWIISVPDDRVRLICIMRFLEGKSWETIARRLHYERTSPAKILRRWIKGL